MVHSPGFGHSLVFPKINYKQIQKTPNSIKRKTLEPYKLSPNVLSLTNNPQLDGSAHFGLRGHLALIGARVLVRDKLDLQRPRLTWGFETGSKSVVGDERVAVHRQDVGVVVAHPRYL